MADRRARRPPDRRSANLTGRQNLDLLARSRGIDRSRVDAAIGTVNLSGRERDRYKGYSLGMKQRLAIAATLLKDPQLLILDEPTNGLDPAGIREIRTTIEELGRAGVTVLLSSHILAEVQQVCDSATIIGNGRMLASGKVDDLLGSSLAHRVRVADPETALRVLSEDGFTVSHLDGVLRVESERPPAEITASLGRHGIWLDELSPLRADLETVFLGLTESDRLGAEDGEL